MGGGGATLLVVTLTLIIGTAGCDSPLNSDATVQQQAEISKIDGEPVITLDAAALYTSDYFEEFRDQLSSNYGGAIIRAMNRKISEASMQSSIMIPGKDLNRVAADIQGKGNLPELGTHIRITNEEGEVEEFVLTLRPYFSSATQKEIALNSQTTAMKTGTTWLALNPDRFYLHDDENGEIWPVTFPAVSLEDPTRTIKLTFNKDGFVSSSLSSSGSTTAGLNNSSVQPNIVLVEATPVVTPNDIEPCEPNDPRPRCNPDPPPEGSLRIDHYGNGGPTGGFTPFNPTPEAYLMLETIHLYSDGDGDGASELQMFVIQNDDYDHNMPIAYKYSFDEFWDGVLGGGEQITTGADQREYWVADVNQAGITYNIYTEFLMCGNVECNGLPIFELTYSSNPWRFVLSDDDKDYGEFNRNHDHEYATDIWTYDMADGSWSQKFTGFTVDSRDNYSSDDPMTKSGVRRITLQNVQERLGNASSFQAKKLYSGGRFAYTFSLAFYNAPAYN